MRFSEAMIILAIGWMCGLTGATSLVNAAEDKLARIQEQYRDCQMIGDLPTKADMLPETDASHE